MSNFSLGGPSNFDSNNIYDGFPKTGQLPLPNNSSGTASGVNPSGTDYDGIFDYFKNILSTVGAENEVNRTYNSAEAQLQREWSSSEAEKQRQWQTEMSNTAYQRAMSDAKSAGLNPILIASGGAASTPSGGTVAGNSASYQYGGGDTLSSLINSIANVASSVAEFLPNFFTKAVGKIGFR